MRRALLTALALCAPKTLRTKTRRFLAGLSRDELQFLAEFLGASILEFDSQRSGSRAELAGRVAEFQKARHLCQQASAADLAADEDHKMILLLEFLCLSGLHGMPLAWRGGRVSTLD